MNEREEKSTLQGTIAKITYQNQESHYTVARLELEGPQNVTIVGEIFPVEEGGEVRVFGFWRTHPRYGLQFQVERWEKLEPATLAGIERYLGSGLIKGIGPAYARRLVAAFGLETLRILSEEPQRLLEVEGIGSVRARRILQAWDEQRGIREVMVFLQGHGIGSSLALRIYRVFGHETVARVKQNPYCLTEEVYGIGFVMADRIAASLGIKGDFPLRVQAGLLHVLRNFSDAGHCFVPMDLLTRNASSLLGVREDAVQNGIRELVARRSVVLEETAEAQPARVYNRDLSQAESRVAASVRRLLSTPSCLKAKGVDGLSDEGGENSAGKDQPEPKDFLNSSIVASSLSSTLVLDREQHQAVLQALQKKVLVVTGGPGTGKTTLLTHLLTLLRGREVSFALAAPTGRAAKRMGEAAGEEAKTIHRLLEYNPHDRAFQRTEDRPLDVDVIIVDEASMVDLSLMDQLLRAIPPRSHLVLLGDVDQLPSVGPGTVLKDMIDSGIVPVVVLRRIFRQANESLIVVNAHRILQGQPLWFGEQREKRDFVFIARENEEEILATLKELIKERLPRSLPPKSVGEVQILSPMHRGMLGTVHLNRELQVLLNPDGEPIEWAGTLFRLGDKVMQHRNNYEKGVFNGDLGRIIQVDKENKNVQVDFYGRLVSYEYEELDELSLAYATSIHKSQGSEYPVVVIPLHTSHFLMLHRSILYTAVTRGKDLVVLVGNKRALAMAIRNTRTVRRYTGLKEKLVGASRAGLPGS